MKLLRPFAFLAALCLALPGLAQERPSGLVAVGDRLFLAPGQPDRQPTGEPPVGVHFAGPIVHLDEVVPVRDVVKADPLLGAHWRQVTIGWVPAPPSSYFGDVSVMRVYGGHGPVPDELRMGGYDVRTVPGEVPPRSFNIRPDGPAPDHMLTCGYALNLSDGRNIEHCSLHASYPLDPAIILRIELLGVPFREAALDAQATADRLREIALCLDVTEAPPAEPEAALAALLATNPRLERCEGLLLS